MVFFSSTQEASQRGAMDPRCLKDLMEHAYKAYYEGTGGQVWRHDEQGQAVPLLNEQGEPVTLQPTLAAILNEGKEHTFNAWSNFVTTLHGQLSPEQELTHEYVADVFDKAYRAAAENKNYSGDPIPPFNELLAIQKEAWLSAAKVVKDYYLEQQQQQEEASGPCAMRPTH